MARKQLILDALLHEIDVVKFLATKVPEDGYDYRPTPGQRSALELMRYLSCCGHRVAAVVLSGNWDLRAEMEEEANAVTPETFATAMDRQADRLRRQIEEIDDREWTDRRVQLPWGIETTVEGLFLNASLKFLVAYRMQLFLYLKGMGQADLSTAHCWLGRDPG